MAPAPATRPPIRGRPPVAALPVPTVRLAVVAAVAAVVVLLVPVGGGWSVEAVVAVVAVADAMLAVDPGALTVTRRMPGTVTAGGRGQVRWEVANHSGRPVRVSLADELAPSLRAGSRRAHLVVPPGGAAVATTTISPVRRGRFLPEEIVLRVDGPLGLMARQQRRSLPGVLRVVPPFRSRREVELRIRRGRMLEVGLRSAQGRGTGTEFDSLREYTVDDDVRRIDWAATARSREAIVRTYRAERNQQVIALVDFGRVMAGQVDGVPRAEWAMDAAVALATVSTTLGDRCGLVAFDRDVRAVVAPGHGSEQLERITGALFDLETRLVESDYRAAFASTVGRFRRRALLVLLTELAEEAVTETLLPALPLLLTRHLVVVGSVTDPDVEAWASLAPDDASGAYRMTAATATLQRRAHIADRLRAMGATVVDAPAGALAARLADAYLDAKATGRL